MRVASLPVVLALVALLIGGCAEGGSDVATDGVVAERPAAGIDDAPASQPSEAVTERPAFNPFDTAIVSDPLGRDGIGMRPDSTNRAAIEPSVPTTVVDVPPKGESRPVFTRLGERGDEVTPGELEVLLEDMEADVHRGDYEQVLRRSDAMIERTLTPSARARLEPLRMAARQHLIQTLYVDGLIRFDRAPVTIGESITGELLLVNLSPDTVTISDTATGASPGGSRSLLRMEVQTTEYGSDGSVVHDEQRWNTLIGEDIVLLPGQRRSFPLKLETVTEGAGSGALRALDVQATIYPAQLLVGALPVRGNIRFRQRRAFALPRNFEHLAADPVGRLVEALAKRSPPHVPVAAALVPVADRREALGILRRALTDASGVLADGPTCLAACIACAILTGEDHPPDAAEWITCIDKHLR